MNTGPVVGAVDLGSTSVKALVLGPDGPIAKSAVVTRLGTGVDRTGRFDPAAVERTLEALRGFAAEFTAHGVDRTRVVATSACRDAADREELFDLITEVMGCRPELLSGADEGRLAYAGARAALDPEVTGNGTVLVVDIGGGSTEFMVGDTDLAGVISIDVGAGRLTERELHSDPPRPEELTNAIGLVWDHLDDVLRELPGAADAGTIVGLGGSVRVAASVELGLPVYDSAAVHGFRFSRAAVEDTFRTLATERLADRLHNPGLPADRAEVIVGGCCVMVAVLRRLDAPGLVVSSYGLLDAAAHELLKSLR